MRTTTKRLIITKVVIMVGVLSHFYLPQDVAVVASSAVNVLWIWGT